jgi:DNA-binding GntR family transcriptional regulator
MVLEPILVPDLVDHVTTRLRDAILTGMLAPGERLVEEQLAAQLDVSRAPVREALRMLEYDGLETGLGRRGRFVTLLTAQDAWEVYTLRAALEALAVDVVARDCPPQLLQELQNIVSKMGTAIRQQDRHALSVLDVRFHRTICSTSGHERLLRAWDSMSNQIRLLSQRVIGTQYDELTDVAERHQTLVDVLATRDPAAAMTAVRAHIQSVSERVVAHLRESESASAVRNTARGGQR